MSLRIKYLGKLKIINQLRKENINLQLISDKLHLKLYKWINLYLNFHFQKIFEQDFFVSSNNFLLLSYWPGWPGMVKYFW